jgi:hypothetical protein
LPCGSAAITITVFILSQWLPMKSATMTAENARLASPCRRPIHLLSPFAISISALCGVLVLSMLSGCGTGEYERRLEQRRVSKSRIEKRLRGLYQPQDVPGTQVSLRLPKILFQESPLVEGAPVGGKPVDIRRIKPQKLMTIPGLKLTYEAFVDYEGLKLPCYCYVGVLDIQSGQLVQDPGIKIRAELTGQRQPERVTNWQDVRLETPEGQENVWKKIRAETSQEFFVVDKAGQGQFKSMPGVLEVYVYSESKYIITIAWRMPASIEKKVNLEKWASLVAECVSVKK